MKIAEIRRNKLQRILEGACGHESWGCKTKLAHRLAKNVSYVSRCLPDMIEPHRKNIGEAFARHIEHTFDLAPYSLDRQDFAYPSEIAVDSQHLIAPDTHEQTSDLEALMTYCSTWQSNPPSVNRLIIELTRQTQDNPLRANELAASILNLIGK